MRNSEKITPNRYVISLDYYLDAFTDCLKTRIIFNNSRAIQMNLLCYYFDLKYRRTSQKKRMLLLLKISLSTGILKDNKVAIE